VSKQVAVIDSFRQELRLMEPNFRPLLPATIRPDKFEALVIAAVTSNPKLLECSRESLWKACVQGAELGLSLNPTLGEADILPVWNGQRRCNEAQFRPRYKGLMKLALQSGEVTGIRSVLVHENDEFIVMEGLRPDIIHKPARGDRGEMTHAYCVWNLKSQSEPQFEIMDRAQIARIKARSSSKNKDGSVVGPWVTDEAEMWRKTVVRRASKYMPVSCDAFQRAIAVDNIAEVGGDIEVTADGEIIDITAMEVAEVDEEAVQVSEIEEAIDTDIPLVDFGPADTWQTWCLKAGNAVKALPKQQRAAWSVKHEALLVEAEESRPSAVKRIKDLIEGAD